MTVDDDNIKDLAAEYVNRAPKDTEERKTNTVTLDDHAFDIVEKEMKVKTLSRKETASSLIRIAAQRLKQLRKDSVQPRLSKTG